MKLYQTTPPLERHRPMKHLLLTTIAAVLVVGCGESQQSAPLPETTPVEPVRQFGVDVGMIVPVAEAAKIGPPTAKESIHRAAETGNIEAVKQHLAAGADVNAGRSDGGGTPLHFAAGWGQKEMVELLIAKGAEVNAKEGGGGAPLHVAAAFGKNEIAELLIAEGADMNAKDDDGYTPLDWAIEGNQSETADLLRKHGGKTGEELRAAGN
jgi:hypothetical protein